MLTAQYIERTCFLCIELNMNIFLLLCLVSTLTEVNSMNLTETAVLVAKSEFRNRTTTSVVWWQADVDQVTDFLTNYHGCVETIDMNDNQNKSVALTQAIFFVTSCYEFLQFVENLDQNIMYPSQVITILNNSSIDLSNITAMAWKYDLSDLIILSLDEDESVAMYTYYPYSNNECGNITPVKLDGTDFFPRKFKNLLGCETRVGSAPYPPYSLVKCSNGSSPYFDGIYGKLFMMIAGHLNTTVKVKCIPRSLDADEELISYITEKSFHIFIPLIFNINYLTTTQHIPMFHFTAVAWCGPPRREIYKWAKVLVPMMNNTTILLGFTYIVLVIIMKIIGKIERIKNKNLHIAWKAFAVLLGQNGIEDSKSGCLNFLSALWQWFCMVITIGYQGELVKGMQTKYLEPPFDTIENAIKLVDGHGGLLESREVYIGTPIWDNWQLFVIADLYELLEAISRGKRFLILFSQIPTLGKTIQFMESQVFLSPMSAAMTPRWGGSLEISSSVTRLVEAGFFQKLLRDQELKVERQEAMMGSNSADFTPGHLSFVTLSTCFYGILVMGLVCFAVLLLEIFHYWLMTQYLKDKFQR